MKLRVDQILTMTDSVKSFVLRAVGSDPLPEHAPGSHLQLHLQTPRGPLDRRYSILSDTTDRSMYQIAVLRDENSQGGSLFMHEQVRQNDILEVSGPQCEFPLDLSASRSVLVAGGIGITAMLSMLRALRSAGKDVEIHYANRRKNACAFEQTVRDLAGDKAFFYFSDSGRPFDVPSLLSTLAPDSHVYVCGPRRLIDAVRTQAAASGIPRANVHFESFGPRWLPSDKPVELRLQRSGITLQVPPGQTLLDAMLSKGIAAPFGCKRGECTACATAVLDGQPDHRDLCLDDDQRRNTVCPCVSWAQSPSLTLAL